MNNEPTELSDNLPIEPKQAVYNPYGQNIPYYSNPYENIGISPLPPPPPKTQYKGFIVTIVALSCVVVVLSGVLFTVIYRSSQKPAKVSPPPTISALAPTLTINTPTADGSQSLQTSDFQTFMSNFSGALVDQNYDAIKQVADTNNFQSICICTADGISIGWGFTYNNLIQGNMTISFPVAILTPAEANFNCHGHFYGSNGVYFAPNDLFIAIPNAAVQYSVGSITATAAYPELNDPPDSVVFIFEQPNHSGQWFWRGYIDGNVAGCTS